MWHKIAQTSIDASPKGNSLWSSHSELRKLNSLIIEESNFAVSTEHNQHLYDFKKWKNAEV